MPSAPLPQSPIATGKSVIRKRPGLRLKLSASLTTVALIIAGCSSIDPNDPGVQGATRQERERLQKSGGETIWGDGGFLLFGNRNQGPAVVEGVGVNSFLWRASLDAIQFMSLVSADPFGGVIITDWYSPSSSKNERFKVNIRILTRDLRADGISVSLFRQTRANANAAWVDAVASKKAVRALEDAILTRARELRVGAR